MVEMNWTCSECGGMVAIDRMRCTKCGHDMLAEDIAMRPFEGAPACTLMNILLSSLSEAKAKLPIS